MPSSPFAVIFDVDGVLVDSYRAHFESWQILGSRQGFSMSPGEFAATFGRTTRETITQLWGSERFSVPQIARLDEEKEAIYRELIDRNFPMMEGAANLIAQLRKDGFRLAVGSSGPPENVHLVVDRLGCDWCQVRITGKDVTRGKPDPEVFTLAAQRLGVPASCCAVIEDAPAGIAAAQAAGMIGIGLVSTGRTHADLADADLIVSRLDELSNVKIRGIIMRGDGQST